MYLLVQNKHDAAEHLWLLYKLSLVILQELKSCKIVVKFCCGSITSSVWAESIGRFIE